MNWGANHNDNQGHSRYGLRRWANSERALEFDRRPSSRAACEFCEAIVALQSMMPQETTFDWSGVDLHTISDHRTVDGRPICLPCIGQYSLEEGKDYER